MPLTFKRRHLSEVGGLPHACISRSPGEKPDARGITFKDIVGRSEKIRNVVDLGRQISEASFLTVLISGETGTGKELFARALHNTTFNEGGPFVEINSTAIPENLLEAELFGYESGAFTDAKGLKKGLLELAHGGTLFLDEIGNMSMNLQVKLLNVLEEKRFRRLGGREDIQVGVKIIAATNTDLQAAIRDGYFREDLYYRLAVVSLELPPLRERGKDVIMLAEHFLSLYCEQHTRPPKTLSRSTKECLLDYHWPGNVRELRNAIQRAVILSRNDELKPEDISLGVRANTSLGAGMGPADGKLRLEIDPYNTSLDEIERQVILKVLDVTGGNKSRAAALLRISRPRLLRRIKNLGVQHKPEERTADKPRGDA